MAIYLRLLKFMWPYWPSVLTALLCMLVFALSNGAMAYLIGPAIKVLFEGTDEAVRFIPFDIFTIPREHVIAAIPIAILVMAVIKGLSSYGNTYYMGFVGQRIIADLRSKLYEHVLRLPVKYFSENTTGHLNARLTNDVNLLQKSSAEALTNVLKQLLSLIVLIAVIISMDWQLAIIASIGFPLAIFPAMKLARKMRRATRKGAVSTGNLNSIIIESLRGVRVIKAFGMERYETSRFDEENEKLTGHWIKTIKVRGISTPLMETLGAAGFAATIFYATYRITSGTLRPENFISFFAAVVLMYQPMKILNRAHLTIVQGMAGATRIFEVIDSEVEDIESSKGRPIKDFKESIEFRDVSFTYGTKEVLKGIDLSINKGELVAIVGSSGAGKTTFVNLIPRFYDVSGGSILIDGIDLRELSLKSLRSLIAVISQEVILFNDTIANNIAYGKREVGMEEIKAAALAANAHGFITRLDEGYDTVIGESGIRLSGGERQRISIARAILKNAPILVMDEATSSLDTESEFEVQKGLANLMEGRTTFVIAHRLSTVKNADRIIVLSNGTIVESGTHGELLRSGGEYARLYKIQFNGLEKNAG